MKLLLTAVLFVFLFANLGCKEITEQTDKNQWSSIVISPVQGVKIIVNNDDNDSVMMINRHFRSIFMPPPKGKIQTDTAYLKFSPAEKDTLANLANTVINNQAAAKKSCTDFVGMLAIDVYYGQQVRRSIQYTSVCDWADLSPETRQLNNLLNRHLKK